MSYAKKNNDLNDEEDFADVVAKEWRDSFPNEVVDSVPAVMRVLRWAEQTVLAINEALKPFGIGRGGARPNIDWPLKM